MSWSARYSAIAAQGIPVRIASALLPETGVIKSGAFEIPVSKLGKSLLDMALTWESTLTGKILAQTVQGQAEGFDLLASIPQMRFPGGATLRWPLLVMAMTWYSLRDRLGL